MRHDSFVLRTWRSWRRERNILIAALVLFGTFSLLRPDTFLVGDNLLRITILMALWTIAGVGEAFIIISGEIDFSIGSLFGFLTMVMGLLAAVIEVPSRFQATYVPGLEWNVWLSAAIVIGIGLVVGLLNGLLVTKVGIPSFIVTLAGWVGWRSAMRVSTGMKLVRMEPKPVFTSITAGRLFGVIPALTIWMLLAVIAGHILLTRTRFGYHLLATGGNLLAAKNTGIKTDRIKIACFVLMGGLMALVTVLWVGFLTAAPTMTGGGFELQVIAAVFIGGTVLGGGRGTIVGTLLGAAVFGMIFNGLTLLGLRSAWQWVMTGVIIVAVVAIDSLPQRQPKLAAFLLRRKQ